MQYVSLSRLPNQYPTLKGNYVLFKDRTILLNGLYPERNKINFALPEFKDIIPISNTTFRFVLAIVADEKDTNPKYFTSKPFFDDIKLSYKVNNPYFPIQAVIGIGSVITISLKEFLEIINNLEKPEMETPVNILRNIFISDSESEIKINNLRDKETELNKIGSEIVALENQIIELRNRKDDESAGRTNGRISRRERAARRNNLKDIDEQIKELEAEKEALRVISENLKKEIDETKNIIDTRTGLLSEKSTINYEELVKFIDYMVSPPKFSVAEIENGSVKDASLIGKWEGQYIDDANKRAAGFFFEATFIDERIVPKATEEDKPKTLVGKAIAAIEKIPVVGLVVKGIKAVGKFLGKLFSDERLKTDLLKVGEINGINIYKFRYKFDTSKIRLGVIAQELLNTPYKNVVSIDKETGFYVIDYNALQEKVDIVGEMKKIKNNIDSDTGGFTKLFKAKILTPSPGIEFDNITGVPDALNNSRSLLLRNKGIFTPDNLMKSVDDARLNRKKFGTSNLNEQNEDSFLFKLRNKKAAKEVSEIYDTKKGLIPKPKTDADLGDFVLKRKGIKTKRD